MTDANPATLDYRTILFQQDGPIATITLNRPEKRNALTTEMFLEIIDAGRRIEEDRAVRVVILTGAGKAFCAGQDQSHTSQADLEGYLRYSRLNRQARDLLRTLSKPVIGRIQGPAVGGGCYLATECCDITIASTNARFALREVQTGLMVPGSFVFTVGRARALAMALTGEWIPAEQAERWGLVYRVVPDEELDAAVAAMAELLAAQPPLGMTYTKRAMNFVLDHAGYDQAEDFGLECRRILHQTADRREAQRSFLERRRGVYVGA
ncbi:MAG: enoyl-CoA hydratase/isomerase family protein [Chloroflexi bacterium]|nr:enoyl-CoA hydratase/isomerase family protein [Chloroflexota bacterium]